MSSVHTVTARRLMLSTDVAAIVSPRERQVVLLAMEGLTVEEMDHDLKVSRSTIKAHLLKIYRKLGIRKRVQLIRFLDALPQEQPTTSARYRR